MRASYLPHMYRGMLLPTGADPPTRRRNGPQKRRRGPALRRLIYFTFSALEIGDFRRRPADFPAPSWGLSGAGDYLFDRFSGAGNNLFVRTDRFPAPSWGPSGAHLFHYVCSYLCAW